VTPPNVQASALRVGERFYWCGRVVEVADISLVTRARGRMGVRPGRWLSVTEEDGRPHRLHYYDTEVVARP
jgi:hypothetical protein